jgi:hypothetical protein
VNGRPTGNLGSHVRAPHHLGSIADRSILHEEAFRRLFSLESKRAQRSRKSFLLALLEVEGQLASEKSKKMLGKILSVLDSNMRETDVTGWYKDDCIVGLMFTEIAVEDRGSVLATIMARLKETLRDHLTAPQFGQVSISFHLFPEERDERIISSGRPLYTDRPAIDEARRVESR